MEETQEELRSELRRHHRDFEAISVLVMTGLRSNDSDTMITVLKKIRNIVG